MAKTATESSASLAVSVEAPATSAGAVVGAEAGAVRIGFISDVQFCPEIPNGLDFTQTRTRYYAVGFERLKHALHRMSHDENVQAVAQLGDLFDHKCSSDARVTTHVDELLEKFGAMFVEFSERNGIPTLHAIGNHELLNFPRDRLRRSFMYPESLRLTHSSTYSSPHSSTDCSAHASSFYRACYHRHDVHSSGCRVAVLTLDTYDVSILNRHDIIPSAATTESTTGGDCCMDLAERMLAKHNPNGPNWMRRENVTADQPQMVGYNGAVGERQLGWLAEQLNQCRQAAIPAIITSHCPLHDEVAQPFTNLLAWNWAEVLAVIRAFSDVIRVCVSGHLHFERHVVDRPSGILFLGVPAMLEAEPDTSSHLTIEVQQKLVKVFPTHYFPEILHTFKFPPPPPLE